MVVKFNQTMRAQPARLLQNQRGVAVVEMLSFLAVFVTLFGLAFGFWTAIHRGTLQSIAARHYAFEVINNRTHFIYHRDTVDAGDDGNKKAYYKKNGSRFFAIVTKQAITNPDLKAVKKNLSLFNEDPMGIDDARDDYKVSPIWLKVGYGICIDCNCSGPDHTVGCNRPGDCRCEP